ncbi:MAG TPA: tRNA uridine-5-carboxymethylaminomethyl(34) synthesis enzyme MnmG [Firmicutes bacterium]|nr:tRNA uridine-5-carboxymethylaminomethyl(34) synthesis enzyme MnmG [Bacillota bacterium]
MDSIVFDSIVIGGGHAGVEASHALSSLGAKTLLLTLNLNRLGNMPCNPHIGGSAKGNVVREIDALGGLMGQAADINPLQMKMLNTGKGPGVQCLRSQQDKEGYPKIIFSLLSKEKNLSLKQEEVNLIEKEDALWKVTCASKNVYFSRTVIVTTGTYLNSRIISGSLSHDGGPDGENASLNLTCSLNKLGIKTFRLKTGTPPRIDKNTIDFSKGEIQPGSNLPLSFSFFPEHIKDSAKQLPCYLIYTTPETISIINNNLKKSALFNGNITSNGPRYCPSIESKVVRFADKPRHQLFLEPETEHGDSVYLQGFSTGMPYEIQEEMVHSLPGLEKAKILKYAYQIEYDALCSFQFDRSLMIKKCPGLFVGGQICGTSGYEEAAGLGLMAGINAYRYLKNMDPVILKRSESYIGVMIDDLVNKGAEEPYRLLSSRAEYRLLLRHDNADYRLTPLGHRIGLIDEQRYEKFLNKYKTIEQVIEILKTNNISNKSMLNDLLIKKGGEPIDYGVRAYDILKRPFFHYDEVRDITDALIPYRLDYQSILALEAIVKYEGYIRKEEKEAQSLIKEEEMKIPSDIDYLHMDGLRLEARSKLDMVRPTSISQAARISGVNPADISILLLKLRRLKK